MVEAKVTSVFGRSCSEGVAGQYKVFNAAQTRTVRQYLIQHFGTQVLGSSVPDFSRNLIYREVG